MAERNQSVIDRVTDLAIDALFTDGSHHKQWYLEEILRTILGIDGFESRMEALAAEGYKYEPGIPP